MQHDCILMYQFGPRAPRHRTGGEPNHGGIGCQRRWRNRFPGVYGHDVQPGPATISDASFCGPGDFQGKKIYGDIMGCRCDEFIIE